MGYTILIWDHIISFDDEVKFIWMQPKNLGKLDFYEILQLANALTTLNFIAVYIFFLVSRLIDYSQSYNFPQQVISKNRYFTPVAFIGNLIGTSSHTRDILHTLLPPNLFV